MFWLWIVAAVIALLAMIVFLDRIKIELMLSREHDNDIMFADVRLLFGIVHIRRNMPMFDWLGKDKGIAFKSETVNRNNNETTAESRDLLNLDDLENLWRISKAMNELIAGFGSWFLRFLAHVRCHSLTWMTEIGFADAAKTGVAVGLAWSLKSSVAGFITSRIRMLANPRITVTPNYAHAHFSTKMRCLLTVRLFSFLVAGMLLLIRVMRAKKGVRRLRKIVKTPTG
ncbi:MAG TPA: DUF2953 domain-containing protein [Bacilli bacterium]